LHRPAPVRRSAPTNPPRPNVAAPALLLAIALLLLLPLRPAMPAAGLEPSWALALNEAVAARLRFGSEVVFTFGPLAFLYTHAHHPALAGASLVLSALTILLFGLQLWSLLRSAGHAPPAAAALGLLLVLLVAVEFPRDTLFLLLALLPLLQALHAPERSARGWLLPGLALGLASLIKGTFLAAAWLALAGLVLAGARRERRVGATLAAYVLTLLVLWLGCGQRLSDLPAFVVATSEIAAGYPDAMAWGRLRGDAIAALAGAGAFALLLLRERRAGTAPIRIAILLWLVLVLKAGFVRHDTHALIATTTLLGAAALLLALPRGRRIDLPLRIALLGAAGWAALLGWRYHRGELLPIGRLVRHAGAQVAALPSLWQPARLDAEHEQALARIRASHPIPDAAGSFDLFPADQALLLAHRRAWSPRPVFQSYSAYTPALAERNAAHLRSPRAPEQILFELRPIDERLPAFDDGLCWPELFARYDLVTAGPRFLHLQRAPHARESVATEAGAHEADAGDWLDLPPHDRLLWCRLELTPPLAARALALAWKPPIRRLELQLAGGAVESYRFVAGSAAAGFLVSPCARDTAEFSALLTGAPLDGRRVTRLRILPADGATLHARFSRLQR
jgi:hypothetical protein